MARIDAVLSVSATFSLSSVCNKRDIEELRIATTMSYSMTYAYCLPYIHCTYIYTLLYRPFIQINGKHPCALVLLCKRLRDHEQVRRIGLFLQHAQVFGFDLVLCSFSLNKLCPSWVSFLSGNDKSLGTTALDTIVHIFALLGSNFKRLAIPSKLSLLPSFLFNSNHISSSVL